MPAIRRDPIADRWVVISPDRNRWPSNVGGQAKTQSPHLCPFCPSHEVLPLSEGLAYRQGYSPPDAPGWTLRVAPKKYAAVQLVGGPSAITKGVPSAITKGVPRTMNGAGAHQVIIDTPVPHAALDPLSLPHAEQVLLTFRGRRYVLRQDTRLRSALILKNDGASAGATSAHPQSRFSALSIIPKTLQTTSPERSACALRWVSIEASN